MTLDLPTLIALAVLSAAVAVAVEAIKEAVRLIPGVRDHALERITYRVLGLALGVALVVPSVDAGWPVAVALGLLAGAASEVVYRWVLVDLLPMVLDAVRRRV